MFSVPNIFDMAMAIQVLFFGTTLIVFISNQITGFIESMASFLPLPLLLVIHLNIICFLYHFLKSVLLWLEIQSTTYKFDKSVYMDTSIIVGPVIGITSTYIRRFIEKFYLSTNYFVVKTV